MSGTRDVVTMMINWASRTDFVAATESHPTCNPGWTHAQQPEWGGGVRYSIVSEFGGELANPTAGAVLAFAVQHTVPFPAYQAYDQYLSALLYKKSPRLLH